MDAEVERIVADGYLGDVRGRSLSEIRSLRDECQRVESQLSYLRRMVQARHDIITGELQRRRTGGERDDVSELVRRLPDILSHRPHAAGHGRVASPLTPGELSGRLVDRLEDIVTEGRLLAISETDDDQLALMEGELEALEHDVSAVRQAVFGPIDTLQAEMTRRYRDGEADVEALLRD